MLRALAVLIPLTPPASAHRLKDADTAHTDVYCTCIRAGAFQQCRVQEAKGGNRGAKVRHEGRARKRQNCDGKQVEGLRFILGGTEHEINFCLSASVAQWEPQ